MGLRDAVSDQSRGESHCIPGRVDVRYHSFRAHISGSVVGLFGVRNNDSPIDSGVDELDAASCGLLANVYSDVAHPLIVLSAFKEKQITFLKFVMLWIYRFSFFELCQRA